MLHGGILILKKKMNCLSEIQMLTGRPVFIFTRPGNFTLDPCYRCHPAFPAAPVVALPVASFGKAGSWAAEAAWPVDVVSGSAWGFTSPVLPQHGP